MSRDERFAQGYDVREQPTHPALIAFPVVALWWRCSTRSSPSSHFWYNGCELRSWLRRR